MSAPKKNTDTSKPGPITWRLGAWGFRFARALWHVERRGLHPASVVYVNLEQEKSYPCGEVSGWLADRDILKEIAKHSDSFTAGDVIRFSTGRLFQVTHDRGSA